MNVVEIRSSSVERTIRAGQRLGHELRKGGTVALAGELGAGKTIFIKGIAKGLGVKNWQRVNSPTFVILNVYQGRLKLYHFDLYRINTYEELSGTGITEFICGNDVTVVEWADKFQDIFPAGTYWIMLRYLDDNSRLIEIRKTEKKREAC